MLYYYPNRPFLTALDSELLSNISKSKDWIYEIKKNGDRLVLQKINGKYNFFNRHKKLLKYAPPTEIIQQLNSLDIPDNTHIDAELLHNHTKNVKHFIYVYDIYQLANQRVDVELEERQKILRELFKDKKMPNVSLADVFKSETIFENWKEITSLLENEGIVCKNLRGKIKWNLNTSDDVAWQIKVRKPSGSYKF